MKRKDDSQLSLFESSGPKNVVTNVPLELAPLHAPDPELVELASKIPPHVRLGTSSWTFPGWSGLVYKRRYPTDATFTQRSLEEYAHYPLFRTVGIDRTYYAPISREELSAYATQLPPDFRAVSKVWQEITTYAYPKHARYGAKAGALNPNFLDEEMFREYFSKPYADAFAKNAGPFVLEIPPSPVRAKPDDFANLIDAFLATADRPAQYAFEIRDAHLLSKRYFDVLRAHNAAHVFNAWSRMPNIEEQMALAGDLSADFMVARLMMPQGGDYERLKSQFSPFNRMILPQIEIRRHVIKLIENALKFDRDIYVIANNKLEGSSPLTIKAVARMLVHGVE